MRTKEFNDVLKYRIDKIKEVLAHKAKEYAKEDRLHNFKQAGKIANMTPELALKGFLMKHLVSIFDMIDEVETVEISRAMWEEKIGDSINYLILLEALVVERLYNTNRAKKVSSIGALFADDIKSSIGEKDDA